MEKVFFVTIVLFCKRSRDSSNTPSLKEIYDDIRSDIWHSLHIGSYCLKSQPGSRTNPAADNESEHESHELPPFLIKKALRQGRAGELSKCMQTLERGNVQIDTSFNEQCVKLKEKHPLPNLLHGISDADCEATLNAQSSVQSRITICPHRLRALINIQRNEVRAGLDKLRIEHLKSLIGDGSATHSDETDFANSLSINFRDTSSISSKILSGHRGIGYS